MNRAGWAGLTVAAISLLGVVDACFYAEPRERPADGGPTAADGAPDAPVADSASPGDAGAAPCPDEAGCTLPRVVQITAGASHTCARLADGSLRCWGYNDHGQLGNGDTTDRLNPTPVTGVTAAVDVATGGSHTCAVTRDGAALCWGANGGGSVGDGTFDDRPTPARVLALPRVAKLACGGHCCARDAAGAVWCWGTNQNGQLGDGTRTTRAVATPVLAAAAVESDGGALAGVTSLTVGGPHTCALDGAGRALCWGSSDQIGVPAAGRETTRPIALEWTGFLSLSAGADHTCARMADRAVRCWCGDGLYQLGTPTPHAAPEAVPNLPPTTDVWSGDARTYARLEDGTLRGWGRLPLGPIDGGPPVELPALSSVAELAVGDNHTCARFTDGTLRCWGQNAYGQLGDGTREDRRLPTPVVW